MTTAFDSEIKRLRRRVRLLLIERYGLYGASVGAVITAVIVLLSSHYDDLINPILWAGTVTLSAMIGCAYGLLKRLNDLSVAIAADKRIGLKERLSTAVAFRDSSADQEMMQALIADASGHISALRSSDVFRHRFNKPHFAFCAAVLLLAGAIIIPQLSVFQSANRRQEVAVMKTQGARIVQLAKNMKKHVTPEREELKKLANRLEKLGTKVQTGRMAKKQAMLKVQRLSKEIEKEQDRLAKENSRVKSMQQAQADMRKANEQLAQKMGEQMPTNKRLADLARKQGPLTPAERAELENEINKYTDPNSKIPIPAELGEALAKLAENKDYQNAMQQMQKLAQKLNTGNISKMDRMMLKYQMDQLAKALKNTDLDKLTKQMAKNAEMLAKLSPQELEKMAREMKKLQAMAKALQKAGAG